MPKRFTDTDKWKKAWFRKLTPKMKLFWDYVTTNCDYCGIWDIDWEMASFVVGQKYDESEVLKAFNGKIQFIEEDKLFIPSFIHFQYGATPSNSKQHQSVKRRLEQYGLEWERLSDVTRTSGPTQQSILGEATESEPKASSKAQELLQKAKEQKEQVEQIRTIYPLNNGGEPANKAIAKAIKEHGFEVVKNGTQVYFDKVRGTDPKFIKSTARFFTEEVFLDFQTDTRISYPHDELEYKLSKFFYEGVKNWTAGIMANEVEIQAGASHISEMLARSEVDGEMIHSLILWIDKHKAKTMNNSEWSWRDIIRTAKDLKERFLKNAFHEFTKSYNNK